jgi:phosphopantetheinyl transferase (holo-ACP synthase)
VTSFVGNDLVDFAADHNRGRVAQPRFLERVLTADERDRVARDDAGDYAFALLWSAKEAAYKAARKRDPALVFAPRRWQVDVDSLAPGPGERNGTVAIAPGTTVIVRWQQGGGSQHGDASQHDGAWQHGDGWLHCIALLGASPGFVDEAVARSIDVEAFGEFAERERAGFSCDESGAVRHLAKRLLHEHGIRGIEIVRNPDAHSGARRRAPPAVYAGENPLSGVDVSLSHDGGFVAAVISAAGTVVPAMPA